MRWMVCFLAVAAAPVCGQDLCRPPTPADRQAVLAEGWASARDRLGAALSESWQKGGPGRPGATGNTAYREWLGLWKWTELLARSERAEAVALLRRHLRIDPDGGRTFYRPGQEAPEDSQPAPVEEVLALLNDDTAREKYLGALVEEGFQRPPDAPLAGRLNPEVVTEWVNDREFTRLLFENLTSEDYAPAVLARLQEIRLAHPRTFREYASLAVALAVVYDQKFPEFWPHPQVTPTLVPRRATDVAAFFGEWVAANVARGFFLDLRTLRPGHLRFLVDAPIAASEMDWARKYVRQPRRDFTSVFTSVVYDHDRLKNRAYDWEDGEYTLAEIRRRGGICVDQAYFAMIAGKARGLPTLFFTGQGTDGGHAWFGFMKADDKWELDGGRYENQNYAVGRALDPQSWTPISDHELSFLARSFRDTLPYVASRDDLLMARRFEEAGETARAGEAFASAVTVCPENEAAWRERGAFLDRTGAPVNDRRAFHQAAIRQFARDRDLLTRHQEALAGVLREAGEVREADQLEAQMFSSNKRRRADLSVGVGARSLGPLIAEGRWDEAFAEYRRLAQQLGRTGGGNFFYDIARPLARALAEAGQVQRAAEVVAIARSALRPEEGSILDADLKKLAESLAAAG